MKYIKKAILTVACMLALFNFGYSAGVSIAMQCSYFKVIQDCEHVDILFFPYSGSSCCGTGVTATSNNCSDWANLFQIEGGTQNDPYTTLITNLFKDAFRIKIDYGDGVVVDGPLSPELLHHTYSQPSPPEGYSIKIGFYIKPIQLTDASGEFLIDLTSGMIFDPSCQLEIGSYCKKVLGGVGYNTTFSDTTTVIVSPHCTCPTSNDFKITNPAEVCFSDQPVAFSLTQYRGTTPKAYLWNFGDGTQSTEKNPTHRYSVPGNYHVTLNLNFSDPTAEICSAIQLQSDVSVNCPEISINGGSVCTSSAFTFYYSNTCTILSPTFLWDFGDGNTSTERYPTHTYTTAGDYTVTLDITDGSSTVCTSFSSSVDIHVAESEYCLPCPNCLPSFSPFQNEKYIISAWVKESNNENKVRYNDASISIFFEGSNVTLGGFKAKGTIIDGWQRIEEEFTVPNGSTSINIRLNNQGTTCNVYFDDIKIHPVKANMKSFVYDPISLKLVAEMDENNYATFYEYDEEGNLKRVKKETERGIKTIQETFSNTQK